MIFTAPHPGSWQEFMMRPENKALPIHEATQKYRHQLLLFENQYSTFIQQQRLIQQQQSQGGGPKQSNTGELQTVLVLENNVLILNNNILNLE